MRVNGKFGHVDELLAHFDNLFQIRSYIDDYQNNHSHILKAIKRYVLNHGKADVNKLETLLLQEKQKESLKQLLSLERIFIISILDATVRGRFPHIEK